MTQKELLADMGAVLAASRNGRGFSAADAAKKLRKSKWE